MAEGAWTVGAWKTALPIEVMELHSKSGWL
jgi:hypothetical protein